MEALKALRGADDAERWCFSSLSAVQCTQRFEREHHSAALAADAPVGGGKERGWPGGGNCAGITDRQLREIRRSLVELG